MANSILVVQHMYVYLYVGGGWYIGKVTSWEEVVPFLDSLHAHMVRVQVVGTNGGVFQYT